MITHAFVVNQMMQDKTKSCHLRLGRVTEKGLVELNKKNLVKGDSVEEYDFFINAYWKVLDWSVKLVSMYPIYHLSMLKQIFTQIHDGGSYLFQIFKESHHDWKSTNNQT